MPVSKPLLWKLTVHQQAFSNYNVIIHKEYPGLNVGDIIEVYHPEGQYSRLLVEVRVLSSTISTQQKGSVSIEASLASSFQLRQYNDVVVNKVETEEVTLDMLELVFKDHFVTRSDCWRLHQSLIGSCVYFCNKVTFVNMRVHVHEMWMKGEKVACGVVGESTKIVYRSKSAKFHIFVQMSSEMWDFDYFGDLYFEKAIMGFLQDLFHKWGQKDLDCNHQVVIVLFSRTYYNVTAIDEFSKGMQREVLCGRDGRFYQDFYKIIRQSEKQDTLQNVILDLKRSFHGYPLYVGCQQPLSDDKHEKVSPKGLGRNSRAAEGNLLEALNLSLSVFEKQYIDCNLEETNCTTLIITPSTGVFEVDEELTMLTRNRLIEDGVGIDLVCLAERPLHAVPLLKFFPTKNSPDRPTIYNVPQWINLSYYSKSQSSTSVFVPRMQVPQRPPSREIYPQCNVAAVTGDNDYDVFDSKVFDYSKPRSKGHTPRLLSRQTILPVYTSAQSSPEISKSISHPVIKKMSLQEDVETHHLFRSFSEDPGRVAIHGSFDDLKFTMGSDKEDNVKISSEHLQSQMNDHLIMVKNSTLNPFKQQSMAVAITLFKHRWLHVFPKNMQGIKMQSQHFKSPAPNVEKAVKSAIEARKKTFSSSGSDIDSMHGSENGSVCHTSLGNDTSSSSSSAGRDRTVKKTSQIEEDWISNVTTGVNWKSLYMPACLPLTLNYFPDETSLNSLYIEYHYTMVIEDLPDIELEMQKDGRFDRSSLPPEKKFLEMLSQRIAQGFQFVTNSDVVRILKLENGALQSMKFDPKKDYVLSMGLTIHHLKLVDTEVHVTRYSLREPLTPKPFMYQYNIWPHNCSQYSRAAREFRHEEADKYNWNNLDRYICETEKDFSQLNEHMKYWRTRFLLLPVRATPFAPREIDGMLQIQGFLRFLEGMNKIKRGTHTIRQLFSCRALESRNVSTTEKVNPDRESSLTPERSERRDQRSDDKRTSPMPIDVQETSKENDSSLTRTPTTPSSSVPLDMPPKHSLSVTSPLDDIIKAMLNPTYGLYFLPKQDNLYNNTFISAEAVAWMIKSIDGCYDKNIAVQLGQRLIQGKFITHASGSLWQSFIDGFYLYYMKEEKKDEDGEKKRFWFPRKTEEELLTSYNIQWLEVAVWRDDDENKTGQFLYKELPAPDFVYMKSNRIAQKETSVPLFKSMEYNLDADSKSARSEWCAISYHGNYHPNKCAYAIEMNWMVATGSVIAELVQKWAHKATSCGVHIVPAPMCAFPGSGIRCNHHPFRKSPFIHLNVESLLKDGQINLFQDFDPKTWPRRMFLFQESILHRFDFLRDIPQTAPESYLHAGGRGKHYQYIHASGSILMKVNDSIYAKDSLGPTFLEDNVKESPFRKNRLPSKKAFESRKSELLIDEEYKEMHGFFWVYNYALSKKWRTTFTGDVATAKKYVATFTDFCANKDDQLLRFWQEACEYVKPDHSGDEAEM